MADRTGKPNFSQGWGIAGFITALAVGSFALAGVIKQKTFHSPNDALAPSGAAADAPSAAH
jgi:hypothetical protein